ncbi:MAG: hypothetical protein JSW50_13130 [Candidatus Latescibacterota bacterium]|nr:MAG: hypothetical protein JSW50_13130 [Candidatus Latescibacterota bacterium]
MTWRGWAVVIVVTFMVTGCRPSPPRDRLQDPAVGVDSLTGLDHLEPDGDGNSETVSDQLSDVERRQNDADRPPATSRRQRSKRLRWQLTAIAGYRKNLSTVIAIPGVLACGFRSTGDSELGYVRFGGVGPIRSVHIGHLNARVGERLILGRSLGMYPVSSISAVRDGFTVSPSLSRWFGRTGVGVEIGSGPVTVNAVMVGQRNPTGAPDTIDHRALWITVRAGFKSVWAGAAVGQDMARSVGQRAPGALSLFGGYSSGAVSGSGEIGGYPGSPPYVAIRLSDGIRTPLRWKMLVFRSPYLSSTTDPMTRFGAPDKTNHGVRLDATVGRPARRLTMSVIAGRVISPLDRKPYRRFLLGVSGHLKPTAVWQCSLYRIDERCQVYPGRGVWRTVSGTATSETRCRISLRVTPHRAVSHSLRLEYATGRRRGSDGVLASLGSRITVMGLALAWQVSAYSITPGGRGYVTRPGVGSYESFALVYGKGSDVSVRLRCQLAGGLNLLLYHGAVWTGQKRTYAGLDWRG